MDGGDNSRDSGSIFAKYRNQNGNFHKRVVGHILGRSDLGK